MDRITQLQPRFVYWLVCAAFILLLVITSSLFIGSGPLTIKTILHSLWFEQNNQATMVLWTLRVPRTLIALTVGAALAVAGLLLQTLTNNPLAEPDFLGISASSSLMIVILIFYGGNLAGLSVWLSISGALIGCLLIITAARLQGNQKDPLRLILAGAAYRGLLTAIVAVILLIDQRSADEIRFWTIGGLAGQTMHHFSQTLLPIMLSLGLALVLIPALSALTLGETVASSLGYQPRLIRYWTLLVVGLLSGSAVALAGPIAFFGLIVPTVSRCLVGHRLWQNFWLCLMLGPILLLLADIIARLLIRPAELPLGIVTATFGAPLMIILIRWPKWLGWQR